MEPQKPIWKRNIHFLALAVFIAGLAFSEFMPFLALYIETLGHFNHQLLNFWSGLIYASMFVVSALVSPWWGKLADRYGRRPMILRAGLGMAIVLSLMGAVNNVWQLLVLRLLQGFFSGFISNCNALIATETPKQHAGQALGFMASSVTAGTLLGPFLGGFIASFLGYRFTFFVTGGLLFISFLLTLRYVHEEGFKPISKADTPSFQTVVQQLRSPQLIAGLLLTTLIIQAANSSINPIVSLFVRELMHHTGNIVLIAGLVAALPGISNFLVALRLGALGDEVGTQKIILSGFIAASVLFFATALVQNVYQLGSLRFLIGFSDACLFPQVQTLLSKNAPEQLTGRLFSWNQSAMCIGNIAGPLLGSTISGAFNYSSVFLLTGLMVVINLLLFRSNVMKHLPKH